MNTKSFIIFIAVVIFIVGGIGIFMNRDSFKPSKLEPFAQCIKDSGAEFYGAFWCTHCQDQKKEFGNASKLLPYIECSNIDNTQTQVCKDKKIESYPTWIFKDGTTLKGKLDLQTLASKTSCTLSQ